MLNTLLVRRKILVFGFLVILVFAIFQLVSLLSPVVFKFSARSALTALKCSLPESSTVFDRLNFEFEKNDGCDDRSSVSTIDEFENNESALFKHNNSSSVWQFKPPFLVGPERVNFDKNEILKFDGLEEDGPIFRNCYKAGKSEKIVKIGPSAYVKNLTKLPNSVIEQANKKAPSFNLDDFGTRSDNDKKNKPQPQVLILHTHATEAYELREKEKYSSKVSSHSRNVKMNVISVGEQIVNQLKAANIETIHDKTIHDDPAYLGAYNRSNETIRRYLDTYKSIKVVLDIHRDAIQNDKLERFAPVARIDERPAAQIMIISGCDTGNKIYPNYEQNLAFACFLQRHLEADYKNLTRPMMFAYKHYNQSLTPGTLLVEIGSNSNSVDEALYAGWLFGKSVAGALKKLVKVKK